MYNREKYLKDCLDSLVRQTLEGLEIIVVDDASQDDSLAVIKTFQKHYPDKIKIIENEKNIGQGASRNRGLEGAEGEYIGFLDSDDYVNFSMYENMYEGAKENGFPEVLSTGLIFVKDNSFLNSRFEGLPNQKGRLISFEKDKDRILDQSPSVCNKLFRRDFAKSLSFLENRMWEDIAYTFTALFTAKNVLCFTNPDYFYRRTQEGISGRGYKVNPHLQDIFAVLDYVEQETKKREVYARYRDQIKTLQITSSLQRIGEILTWPIDDEAKKRLACTFALAIIEKYGDWRELPIETVSSKIGILELETINDWLENFEERNLVLETELKNIL